ncbi:MAG: TonB family protein [Cyclobacteriaceae bacterium]
MSKDKNHIDLLRYLRGEMSHAEANAFERKALDDPFLMDAIEGAEGIGAEAFEKDLLSFERKLSGKSGTSFTYLKIAAAIALLILGGYSVWFMTSNLKSDQVAQTETEAAQEINPEKQPEPEQGEIMTQDENRDKNEEAFTTPPPSKEPKEEIKIEDSESKADREVVSEVEVEFDMDIIESPDVVFADAEIDEVALEEEAETPEEKPAARSSSFFKARKNAAGAVSRSSALDELPKRELRGIISDDFGDPIPGVSVTVEDTREETTSDMSGYFELTSVDDSTRLDFSSVGMESLSITLGARDSLSVKLREDEQALQEVVVSGYGAFDNEPEGYFGASPVIGHAAFKDYLEEKLMYPEEARDKGIEGRVVLQLTISPIGQITNIEVKRGIGSGCDEEAIRLIREGPAWSPATQDGLNVETKVRVKVKFELE